MEHVSQTPNKSQRDERNAVSCRPGGASVVWFESLPRARAPWLQPVVPTPAIAHRFDELTAPLMAKIKANSTQSRTLANLRDTLLPKLLSGELRVSKLPRDLNHIT